MKGSGSVSVQIITDPDTGGTKTYGSRSGSGSGTNGLERVQKLHEQIAGQFNCSSKNKRFLRKYFKDMYTVHRTLL